MTKIWKPAAYDSWYHTARGSWVSDQEYKLMRGLLSLPPGAALLDVGCGSGHFSRRFMEDNLHVTGIDPDPSMLQYARCQSNHVNYLQGSATRLPFPANTFDASTAITSLCFVAEVEQALREMWRISRHQVVLGLLNRRSLLHYRKRGLGGYTGARWDSTMQVRKWLEGLNPSPRARYRYAVFLPDGGTLARISEPLLPKTLPYGSFLAVSLTKPV